ncbi:hypothetical protein EDD86DRAFT_209164 [Gorgonomyces haynaldii]|nr:hypothetical protein EDD86DRAFT_209164 [Gorgonomyces haynaldii]
MIVEVELEQEKVPPPTNFNELMQFMYNNWVMPRQYEFREATQLPPEARPYLSHEKFILRIRQASRMVRMDLNKNYLWAVAYLRVVCFFNILLFIILGFVFKRVSGDDASTMINFLFSTVSLLLAMKSIPLTWKMYKALKALKQTMLTWNSEHVTFHLRKGRWYEWKRYMVITIYQ